MINGMSLELTIYLMDVINNLGFPLFLLNALLLAGSLLLAGLAIEDEDLRGWLTFGSVAMLFAFVITVAINVALPSKDAMEKMVAVHIGKELIEKTPLEVKEEITKLPVNILKKLNEVLETEQKGETNESN
jgi:hypothetical protein